MALPARARADVASGASKTQTVLDEMAASMALLSEPKNLAILDRLRKPANAAVVAKQLDMDAQDVSARFRKLAAQHLIAGDAASSTFVTATRTLYRLANEIKRLVAEPIEPDEVAADRTVAGIRVSRGSAAVLGRPCLVLVDGLTPGRVYPLRGAGPWTLGRGADSEIGLEYDSYVSSRHARVVRRDKEFVLQDHRSRNGSFHNMVRLPAGKAVDLAHGDLVGVGKSLLVFWA